MTNPQNTTDEDIMDKSTVEGISEEEVLREKFKNDFIQDMRAAEERHAIMNYCYLQYKGILALNSAYGEEYMKNTGLQVNVPRTFMTVETLKSNLQKRPLTIGTTARTRAGKANKEKARYVLKGEWDRSKAQHAKNDAEADAFVFGTGYLLSVFVDDTKERDVFVGDDVEGKIKTEKKEFTRYKGMKLRRLNPYQVFRDCNATTHEPGEPGTWGHCYVYSVWDFDEWKELCEQKGFKTDGMVKGGLLKEFDAVRRRIDSIFGSPGNSSLGEQTTDDGRKIQAPITLTRPNWKNKIMVLERFEEDTYTIMSGANYTINYQGINPDPDKTIPIYPIKDYRVPGEFEGIGEPEVLRWQQYTENKVHNLAYLQMLINTVQRYAVKTEFLKDPTQVRSSNPLQPIELKNIPTINVNDVIQPLNQGRATQYPKDFLNEVKDIGQSATGVNDYLVGANQSQADTLGEAEMMTGAGGQRLGAKIHEIEERDIVPVLEHWLACIPQYYTEEMELRLNDNGKEEYYVKFVPYIRKFNDHVPTVAKLVVKEGQIQANTIEEIYKAAGYQDVVFVDDITQGFDIFLKTSGWDIDRTKILGEFTKAVEIMRGLNADNVALQKAPEWDTNKLGEEVLNQFPEIIKDVEDYRIRPEAPIPQVDQKVPQEQGMQVEQQVIPQEPAI